MPESVIYVPVAPSLRGFSGPIIKEATYAANKAAQEMDAEFESGGNKAGKSGARGINNGLKTGNYRATGQRIGSELAQGLRSSRDPEQAGHEQGRRYARAFGQSMRSGFNFMSVAFGLVTSSARSIVRNIGTAATVIGLASRAARMFSVSLLAGATGLKMLAGVGLAKLAGMLRIIATIAGRVATQIARITSAILVLKAVASVIGTMTRLARVMGMLTIGSAVALGALSALTPVIMAVGSALVTLGAIAGGAAVAGLSAVGFAAGTLKVGLFGVGDAFKAMGKSATGGGGEAVDTAKQIKQAEYQLAQAIEDEKDAQEDVGKARDDARKKLRDLDLQLKGAALSEKEAALDLKDARKELAAGGFKDADERERAVLREQQAQLRLTEIQRENSDLEKDAAATRAKGVEGSDEVVAAQERVRDATHQVEQAQGALNDARNPKTQSSAGSDPYAEAMAKLSTNTQEFMNTVQGIKPVWDGMRKSVQDSLFADLSQQVQPLADTWIPRLGGAMRLVAGGFNQGAKSAAGWLNSAQGINLVGTWLNTSAAMASRFGTVMANLLPGLAAIGAGAGQAFEPLTRGLGDSAKRFSDWLVAAQESGKIKEYLQSAMATVGQVFRNVAAVVGPLINVFQQLGATSAAGLAPGFVSIGQAIAQATPGLVKMAETLMPALGQVMTNLAPILPAVVDAFTPWSEVLAAIAPHIATLITWLAPIAPTLLLMATVVKALTIAMAIYNTVMLVVSNATKIWTGIQIAFNAVMAMNPFVLIIIAIVALVAAIVLAYRNSETFRDIVQKAWEGIKNAAMAVWTGFLKPMFDQFMAALKWVGDAALWLWNTAIVPAFNGIKGAISIWWSAVQVYFNAAKAVFSAIGSAAMWLWNNAIVPAFNGIKMAVGIWWAAVQIYFNAAKAVFFAIGEAAMWLWNNAIVPAFDGIKAAGTAVGDAFGFLWNSVIKPIWDALGAGISFVIDNIVKPAFEGMKTGLKSVGDFFGNVVEGIRLAWDKLKGFVATPINFVIETVWNNGLLKAWNKVAGFLPGLKEMAPLDPVKFKEGGPVPLGRGAQRGKDSVHALMMPDEHVWDVKDVNRAGGHGAMYQMRNMVDAGKPFTWTPNGLAAASEGGPLPRFEEGGAVTAGQKLEAMSGEGGLRPIGILMRRIIFKLWKNIKDIGGYRQDAYPEHPSGRALDVMVPDLKTGDEVNAWTHANAPKFPIEHTIWKQRWRPQGNIDGTAMEDRGSPTQNHMDHVHSWYKEQNVDPNVVPAGLVGFDGLTSADKLGIIQKKIKEILDKALDPIKDGITSAIGAPPPEWLGIPPKALTQTKDAAVDSLFDFAGKLGDKLGDAYDKAKDVTTTISNVFTNPGKAITGLFRDQGGYLPAGTSVVRNETGRPEAVLNWDQLEEVRKLMEATAQAAGKGFLDDTLDFFGFKKLYDAISGAIAPTDQGTVSPDGEQAVDAGTSSSGSTYTDPTYGDGSTVESKEVPLETKMPDLNHTYDPNAGAEQWRDMAMEAMKRVGFDYNNRAQVDAMIAQIKSESGGDPNISQQITDVNGTGDAAGVGLLQIIPTTYAAHRDPELPDNRRDPFSNMVAALRYYKSRYGMDLTQQWGHGHGYDSGGWLKPGVTMAVNKTGRPEAILTNQQWGYIDDLLESLPSASTFKAVADMPANSRVLTPNDYEDEGAGGIAGRGGEYHAHYHTEDVTGAVLLDKREQRRLARSDALVGGW